jgi:diguanylate cyclase (GGDEF)-like protein
VTDRIHILVVDDNATNRKLLVSLLAYEGYRVTEAADGVEGLTGATRDPPQLVISDILMPSMDGYEFVRRLRANPATSAMRVIFYTANYHEREARSLADQCGVADVIVKPCAAPDLVRKVEEVLSGKVAATPAPAPGFDTEHLRLLTDKLSQKADSLRATNSRLAALTEVNLQMASEDDPDQLLQSVCTRARELLAARFSVIAVAGKRLANGVTVFASGLQSPPLATVLDPREDTGPLGAVFAQRQTMRMVSPDAGALDLRLPAGFPGVRAALAAPVCSLTRTYGWLCLGGKIGADSFDGEDERLLTILAAQLGRIYENGSLYREVQEQATQLLVEIEERKLSELRIVRLNRTHSVLSGINSLIVRATDRLALLQDACRLAVDQGNFRVAWCGLLNAGKDELQPAAYAGDADEFAASVRIRPDQHDAGSSLALEAMQTRQLTVCNDLSADRAHTLYKEEFLNRGYRSVAVLPLVVGGQTAGCFVLFTDTPEYFDDEEKRLLVELADDISFALDHIGKAERLSYLASHDSLTGLMNRSAFEQRVAEHVAVAAQTESRFAVVVADPERFEALNNTLGRAVGDELLRQLGRRFAESAGGHDVVAHFGGDQFAAIIPGDSEIPGINTRLEDLWRNWLAQPFEVHGHHVELTAKGGVALYPNDGATADALLANATAALRNAKDSGATLGFYTRHLSERFAERLALEKSLRRALENGEYELHYQPKVELVHRRMVGMEALLRWRRQPDDLVSPAVFVPLLEQSGMIVEVGTWVMRQACRDRRRWLEQGLSAPRIAVNVSAVQLHRDDFVSTVEEAVRCTGLDAGLDIEVTESVLMDNVTENLAKLADVRRLGVNIALDDFGTGYSSLAYLAKLPVQTLKIDRSFVAAMLDDSSVTTLVSTIISLARSMKLETVAEGVESEEQAKILRLLGCDEMQGYLFSKPLAFREMTTLLERMSR